MKERIVLGLSGGVDSAVAAALLKQSYDVHCLYLDIGGGEQAKTDAENIASVLNLPFTVRSIQQPLEQHVCVSFAETYLQGHTPIPCALCNPNVKFPALLRLAEELGASKIATGHYARIGADETGNPTLCQGTSSNDQVYMLARLPKELLSHLVFPLAPYEKTEVRELAKALRLPVFQKPDSMEICFIPDNDYAAWIERRGTVPPPGEFIDPNGHVLGRHKGIHHYTLGQRRGLGVAAGRRIFVSKINPATNQITLSDGDALLTHRVLCHDLNWLLWEAPVFPMEVSVKLRHTKQVLPAQLSPLGEYVQIDLEAPARAPTPGQMAVFYQNDRVLGSGWILEAGEDTAE